MLLEVVGSPGCVRVAILSLLKHSVKETNTVLFFYMPCVCFRFIPPPEFWEISFLHHLFLLLDAALFKSLLTYT